MNIKALIASAIVIGSTSLAMASPYDANVELRDHRTETVQVTPAPLPAPTPAPTVASWGHKPIQMVLSSNDKLDRDGDTTIRLRSMKPLRMLTLQATGGKTEIKDVTIKFANGQSQTVCLDKTLANGSSAQIDLAGNYRKVVSLYVTGSSGRRASFEVLGA